MKNYFLYNKHHLTLTPACDSMVVLRRPAAVCLLLGPVLAFHHSISLYRKQRGNIESLSPTKIRCSKSNDRYQEPSLSTSASDPGDSVLQVLAGNAAICLIESDRKRATGFDGSSTGWTSWIDEASAFLLQSTVNSLCLGSTGTKSDSEIKWIRWLQASPSPLVIELSDQFRELVREAVGNETVLEKIDCCFEEFLPRISCRLIALPSGSTLQVPLRTTPGAIVYGKLLAGGVTRFRMIGTAKTKRRAGERTVVVGNWQQPQELSSMASWLQYGGPERNYQALDMGFCLMMELTLLPSGLSVPLLSLQSSDEVGMSITTFPFVATNLFSFREELFPDAQQRTDIEQESWSPSPSLDVCDLEETFCNSVGGLRPQIDEIVRRVLDGRVVRAASSDEANYSEALDRIRREEMKGLLELGLEPVRGLLLYGPPGCGKTQLAREISTILDARSSKIVAAPELLDRWVGGSEKLIRDLFADAEKELKLCSGDPTKSALHVVVIDECDAVFRRRSDGDGPSDVTRASAVNQILAQLDGVNALGNVLLIGMTNRKELLDPALLRPGRMEVHVEIPLPDKEGRRDILAIHFGPLRQRGRLSQPLCDALDGRKREKEPSTVRLIGRKLKFDVGKRLFDKTERIRDLAADRWTKGYSGAELAGLVRSAGSFAMDRSREQGDGSLDSLYITLEDVSRALAEIGPR